MKVKTPFKKTQSGSKQSPIKKAKDVLKHIDPKNPKTGTPKTPKPQNGNVQKKGKSPAQAKKEKPNKMPVMNEPSDSDGDESSSEAPKVPPFGGTAVLGDAAKTPAKATQKAAPAKKGNKEKKSDAKKVQQMKKRKMSLVHTVQQLIHKKELAKLRQLLPTVTEAANKLQGCESASAKRKLRILLKVQSRIESGNLEATVMPVSKKNKPTRIPKEVLKMTQDDDEDDGKTWVEKVQEAGSEDDEDDEDVVVEKDEEEDDEDDEDDEEEDEDDEEEDEEMEVVPPQPAIKTKGKKLEAVKKAEAKTPQEKSKSNQKKRYVLFVGNLSYDSNEEKIKRHFAKTGNVVDVRLGKDKATNKSRGFCHIEFGTEEAYQKGLSLHHTILDARQINVVYSQGKNETAPQGAQGGNKKNNLKVKDMKLKGMMKKGMLAGSTKDSAKRSARRKKAAGQKS